MIQGAWPVGNAKVGLHRPPLCWIVWRAVPVVPESTGTVSTASSKTTTLEDSLAAVLWLRASWNAIQTLRAFGIFLVDWLTSLYAHVKRIEQSYGRYNDGQYRRVIRTFPIVGCRNPIIPHNIWGETPPRPAQAVVAMGRTWRGRTRAEEGRCED